jgi:hypothetical protein
LASAATRSESVHGIIATLSGDMHVLTHRSDRRARDGFSRLHSLAPVATTVFGHTVHKMCACNRRVTAELHLNYAPVCQDWKRLCDECLALCKHYDYEIQQRKRRVSARSGHGVRQDDDTFRDHLSGVSFIAATNRHE